MTVFQICPRFFAAVLPFSVSTAKGKTCRNLPEKRQSPAVQSQETTAKSQTHTWS